MLIGVFEGPLELGGRSPGEHSLTRRARSASAVIAAVLHPGAVPSFGVSICVLSLVQAALVAWPAPREIPLLAHLRSGWWATIPALSVVAFVFGERALSGLADGLTYLALIAVPPLAAVGLGWAMRRGRPWFAPAAALLFALAWADRQGLAGESAALALDALSAVTLAVLLVAVSPRALVKLGIVAMAAVDTWLVLSDLLAAPNVALNAAAPAVHLPALQRVVFGSAVMGYGDVVVAALLGALLARDWPLARRGAAVAALLCLSFDLLFLVLHELPATVPIALTLLVLEAGALRTRRRTPPTGPA